MSNEHKNLYEFDKFRLDVSERILWDDGKRIPLSEKAFETLCALVRRGNHLVGKEELLNEVWAGAIVEENNLDKNISILRQILGERAGRGKFIETVRGHGFRFVPEVHRVNDAEISETLTPIAPGGQENSIIPAVGVSRPDVKLRVEDRRSEIGKRSATRTYLIVSGFALLSAALTLSGFYAWSRGEIPATVPIKTIAVLPFKPLVAGDRNEALEMGMTETLISKLGGGEITVRPLGSVRSYTALDQDPLTAGRELATEAVLDGTIQTSGERIRISARLLQTSDGKQLWKGQFDEKLTDIFSVQDAISGKVAAALMVKLAGGKKRRYTENVEAYQLYMKGRFHVLKAVKPEIETGVSYFQKAIVADPEYALVYFGLADAYRALGVGGEAPSGEVFPKARAAANEAIKIDDSLAEAHAALGHVIFWYDWDWEAAETRCRRALELDPNSADALQFYSHLLSNIGRHPEALTNIKLAREIDPLNLRINALEGMFLLHAGQLDEAIIILRKVIELDPNFRLANMFIARAYIEKGMFAEAIAATRKAREISALSSEPIAYGSYALAKSGKLEEARASLNEMRVFSKTQWVPPYHFALIHNALGETERALDFLEKGFAEKDVRMVFLKVEPKWNNLRNEPRFIDLMRRMNFE